MAKQYEPYEGEDGRLYFRYALGAEYEYTPPACKKISQRIVECKYENGKEYYRLASEGKILPALFSVDRLERLLSQVPYAQTARGESVELPLLIDEVESFYEQKRREADYANAQANKQLKGTGYGQLNQKNGSLLKCLMLAKAEGRTSDAEAYEKQIAENRAKQDKILEEKSIDRSVLKKVAVCALCGDSGVVDGEICPCAMERAEQIKAFNAAIRLEARRGSSE